MTEEHNLDYCNFCGNQDHINYIKEPSEDPDCHISYCERCSLVVCEECCLIDEENNDIICPDCENEN